MPVIVEPAEQRKPVSARRSRCPLSLHPTGQWYKKIHFKFYYFGKDKAAAVRAYEEQATYLHSGKGQPLADRTDLTLLTLCNLYMDHQEARLNSGEIGPQHYYDQRNRLRAFVKYLGPNRKAGDIVALDIQSYRTKLINGGGKPNAINNHIAVIKSLFHWAEDNEVIQHGPKLRAIKKVKIRNSRRDERRGQADTRQTFTPEQIHRLLEHASVQMRAIIWLGLNCAFGCTDVGDLRWDDLDLAAGTVSLPRGKTGVFRSTELWPQTVEALQAVPRTGPLVFYTRDGNPFVRHDPKTMRHIDSVSKEFSKLIKKAGIEKQPGTGFYTLRRTAATVAAKTGNPYAVEGLLGHKDTRMASTYIQEVQEQTVEAVNHINGWLSQQAKK